MNLINISIIAGLHLPLAHLARQLGRRRQPRLALHQLAEPLQRQQVLQSVGHWLVLDTEGDKAIDIGCTKRCL